MKISKLAIIAFALLVPVAIQAQKKKVVKKRPAVMVAEPQEDPRITEMREATQVVVFIDSVVIDKAELLSAIRLDPESGTLTSYEDFFRSKSHPDSYVFLNEMGNKCYFSETDGEGKMQLMTSDKLGKEWSTPTPLEGFGEGITDASFPFVLTDGTTLYFAAKGEGSIGGYDIFFTRYDSGNSRFYKAENIGMPFNSEANDYMFVIDEISNIGYFATDRRQPEGKVCVYIFIPPTSRRTYPQDKYSTEQLRSLSEIRSIANTWDNENERKQALLRLQQISNAPANTQQKPEIYFVVNDKLTYTSSSQFRNPESAGLFQELQNTKKRFDETKESLEKLRNFFAKADVGEQNALRVEILNAEQQYEQLNAGIKSLEKLIRNAENTIINQ